MDEIWPKVEKLGFEFWLVNYSYITIYRATFAPMSNYNYNYICQIITSYMASQIGLIEQTNFPFYPIKIRLEIAEIWQKVAKQLATEVMGTSWWLGRWLVRLYYLNRQILSFIPSKSNLKWLRSGQNQQNSQSRQFWETSRWLARTCDGCCQLLGEVA